MKGVIGVCDEGCVMMGMWLRDCDGGCYMEVV